jgi:hypothetical protein
MIIFMENFRKGDIGNNLIGYRVMRFNPRNQEAVSGADSREGVFLTRGGVMDYGQGHFLTNDPQYAKDYYGVHDNNVLIEVEFSPDDILSGNINDSQPEISVSSSIIRDWELFGDTDLEENNMSEMDKTYNKIMEDVGARADELGLEFQGEQDMGDGTVAPIYVNPANGKSFIVPLDANIDDIARQYGVINPVSKFDKAYSDVMEDMVSGPGGAWGGGDSIGGSYNPDGGPIGGADNYAPGDARIPKVLGAKEEKKKKSKKKSKKDDKSVAPGKITFDISRRTFPNM